MSKRTEMADYLTIAECSLAQLDIWERSSQTDFVDENPSDRLEVVTDDGDRFELVQDPGNLDFYHWEGRNGKILSSQTKTNIHQPVSCHFTQIPTIQSYSCHLFTSLDFHVSVTEGNAGF